MASDIQKCILQEAMQETLMWAKPTLMFKLDYVFFA
uniref:Uncharacterized protein n=1 Tax=Rhizophora mucronata TaxID=61149 RepID=A0A2P2NS40_RHIMU